MTIFDHWSRLAPDETVHPDDRGILEGRKHSFQLDLPPGHITGPLLTAPVVICYGNPGYNEDDRLAARDPSTWTRLSKQKEGTEPYPMWLPGWKNWITERTRQINLAPEVLSHTVATLNVVPYASVSMSDVDEKIASLLPSVRVARDYLHETLIPRAQRGEIFLVVIRKHSLWLVDKIAETRTLRIPRNLALGGALGDLGSKIREWLEEGHHVNMAI